ncbi:MAG: glycosyltransferase family 39 protein [Planctomycetaceae bacterium]|nr:glycosyltransferase family 39 protein [Planctomycetaceae bacterium]
MAANAPTRSTPREPPRGWLRRPEVWVLGLAAVFRAAVLVAGADALEQDPDAYRAMAEEWIGSGGLTIHGVPSAYRPPLYPLLLGLWGTVFGLGPAAIGALQFLLGMGTVALVLRIGRHWERAIGGNAQPAHDEPATGNPSAGTRSTGNLALVAGLLVAIDPILLYQSTQVMTETLATLLGVAGLWALGQAAQQQSRAASLGAGVLLALATLCRPTFLLWGLVSALTLGAVARPPARRWSLAIACTLGLAAGLAPWGIRNLVQLGRPVVTTTHGGFTLLLANNSDYYEHLRRGEWGKVWTSQALVARWHNEVAAHGADTELARDRLAYQLAWSEIRQQPLLFAYACAVRCGRLWGVVPHRVNPAERTLRGVLRWSVGVGYTCQHLLAIAGLALLARRGLGRGPWLWALLLVLSFTAAHLAYWTDLRMRAPLVPAESLFAAAGATALGARLTRRKPL